MLSSKEISMLIEATGTSVYMTLASTLMAYVIGLPIGILLVVCAPGGLKPKAVLYKILDFIVNITRSIPFLILMLLATPLARLVTGKSYGANATIISLTLAAAPFIARLVESSLLEVDKGVIEAAQSMGASIWQIVFKVLIGEARVSLIVGSTIALGTVLGYTAMSGAIGGGGLAAGVDHVVVPVLGGGGGADADEAVLRLELDFHPVGQIVGHLSGHADAQVDQVAVPEEAGGAADDQFSSLHCIPLLYS